MLPTPLPPRRSLTAALHVGVTSNDSLSYLSTPDATEPVHAPSLLYFISCRSGWEKRGEEWLADDRGDSLMLIISGREGEAELEGNIVA